MTQATLNLRLDPDLKEAFMAAAAAMDRNGSQLIRDFMRQTVERQHNEWFREQVQAGIEQADCGELISNEAAETSAAAWRAKAGRKLAGK